MLLCLNVEEILLPICQLIDHSEKFPKLPYERSLVREIIYSGLWSYDNDRNRVTWRQE